LLSLCMLLALRACPVYFEKKRESVEAETSLRTAST